MNALRIIRSAALVGSLLALPAGAHAAPGPTNLSFWVIDDSPLMRQLVGDFMGTHPAIQIQLTYVPADRYVSRFSAAVAAGTGPDLADMDVINAPNFAAKGLLADITTQARHLPAFSDLSPAHLRLGTYRDKIFALPLIGDSSVLLYNKTLFHKAGLDPNKPPATWSAIEQDARKITGLGNGYYGYAFSGNCAGCIAFEFLPLIWASGGDLLDSSGTHATLTGSPQVRAALAFYRRLWIDGVVPPSAPKDNGTLQQSDFESGTVGMTIIGDSEVGYLEGRQDPPFDFGVGYIPGQNGGRSAFAGGEDVAIVRGSPHVAAAWEFISWCLDAYAQRDILLNGGADPVRADILQQNDYNWDARRVLAAQAMFKGSAPYTTPYFALFNDQSGPLLSLFGQAVFDGHVDTAIARAQQRFTQILGQS